MRRRSRSGAGGAGRGSVASHLPRPRRARDTPRARPPQAGREAARACRVAAHERRRVPGSDARVLQAARRSREHQRSLRRGRARLSVRRRRSRRVDLTSVVCAESRRGASTVSGFAGRDRSRRRGRCARGGRRCAVRRGACLRIPCPRLPPALGRRPLHPLHRRHHRAAARCRVATGRHLLRRARRREPRWPTHRAARRHRSFSRREPGRACAPVPRAGIRATRLRVARSRAAHARGRSVVGARHAARRRARRDLHRCAHGHDTSAAPHRARADRRVEPRRRPERTSVAGRAARRARCVRHVVAAHARLGRQHAVGRREARTVRRAAQPARDHRGHRLVGVTRAGGVGHEPGRRAHDAVNALRGKGRDDGRRRRPATDHSGLGRGRAAGDARLRARRLLRRSRAHGTHAGGDRRTPVGATRRHGDDRCRRHRRAARPRFPLHQHRRREGVPRRGGGGARRAPQGCRRDRRRRARRAVGTARRRGGATNACRRSTPPRRAPCALPRAGWPDTRRRAPCRVVKAVQRSPAGKADYGWASAIANGD